MLKLLWRVLLSALAIYFVLPHIDGISFHGNFPQAIALGAVFALISWLVSLLAVWLTAVLGLATLGLALIVLVPLWVFGWWLLPAITLDVVARLMPEFLTVSGVVPCILGGLVMLFVGFFSGGASFKVTNSRSRS